MAEAVVREKPEEQMSARERARAMQVQIDLEREAPGYWASALYALRRDKLTLAAFGALLLFALFCVALAGPITKTLGVDPNDTDPLISFEGPSKEHPLGVDQVGRDQLARLLYGGRVSLGVGFFAAVIIMTVGVAVGTVAGYYGKFVDDAVMWFICRCARPRARTPPRWRRCACPPPGPPAPRSAGSRSRGTGDGGSP